MIRFIISLPYVFLEQYLPRKFGTSITKPTTTTEELQTIIPRSQTPYGNSRQAGTPHIQPPINTPEIIHETTYLIMFLLYNTIIKILQDPQIIIETNIHPQGKNVRLF